MGGWAMSPASFLPLAPGAFTGPPAPSAMSAAAPAYQQSCEFYVDYAANPVLQAMYFAAENEDGYYRDRRVFSDTIDIEDTLSVTVRYQSGAQLAYSLIAHAAYEAWRAAVNGTAGRIELQIPESGALALTPSNLISVFNAQGEPVAYVIPKAGPDHGRGGPRLPSAYSDRRRSAIRWATWPGRGPAPWRCSSASPPALRLPAVSRL
jgi:hypothetical protein